MDYIDHLKSKHVYGDVDIFQRHLHLFKSAGEESFCSKIGKNWIIKERYFVYIILCGLFFNIIDIYTHIKALRVRTIVDILNCYNFVNEIVRQSI